MRKRPNKRQPQRKSRRRRPITAITSASVTTGGTTAQLEPKTVRVYRETGYPKDWWQAVKDRFFPVWAKLRWPVQYNRIVWWEEQLPEPESPATATITASGGVSIKSGTYYYYTQ